MSIVLRHLSTPGRGNPRLSKWVLTVSVLTLLSTAFGYSRVTAQAPAAARVTLSQLPPPAWGDTTVDSSGAVVIKVNQILRPTSFRSAQRYGFYEVVVSSAVPISHYSVSWTQDAPSGSLIRAFTGALDYKEDQPGLEPQVRRAGTSLSVTLAKPSKRVGITFDLYSGIGMPDTALGASPRIMSLTVSSTDTPSLSVSPLPLPEKQRAVKGVL